jgi:hypothetical protein
MDVSQFLSEYKPSSVVITSIVEQGDGEGFARNIKRAGTVCRSLAALLWIFSYGRAVQWREVLLRWALSDANGQLAKEVKYHLLWLANKGRDQELPKPIDDGVRSGGFLVDGSVRTWSIRKLMREKNPGRRDRSFGETLLLGVKRGMPSLDARSVEVTLRDYIKLMEDQRTTDEELVDEVTRTVGEVVGLAADDFTVKRHFSFSNRAGVEADGKSVTIPKGGIRGKVWRWAVDNGYQGGMELHRMYWDPVIGLVTEYKHGLELDYALLWSSLLTKFLECPENRKKTVCMVAPIFEPLKLRTITKGQWDVYALGKPLQTALWQTMQIHPIFRHTGEKISEVAMTEFVNSWPVEAFRRRVQGDWFWKSADFKDATNSLHQDVSLAALQTAFPLFHDLAKALCGSHRIIVPLGDDRVDVEAVRGQLMGSPLSFPLLCLINAAVLRMAFELRFKTRFSIGELPARINGDDLVVAMDSELHTIWRSLIGRVGLVESQGKSYEHKDWFQINSRTYDVERVCGVSVCRERAFVNFSYLFGIKKGTDPQDEPMIELLAGRTKDEWEHLGGLRGKVWGRAVGIYAWQTRLLLDRLYTSGQIPYRISTTNPVEVGGLGWAGVPDLAAAQEALRWRYKRASVQSYLDAEDTPESGLDDGFYRVENPPRCRTLRELESVVMLVRRRSKLRGSAAISKKNCASPLQLPCDLRQDWSFTSCFGAGVADAVSHEGEVWRFLNR